jgi:hypothetical protein
MNHDEDVVENKSGDTEQDEEAEDEEYSGSSNHIQEEEECEQEIEYSMQFMNRRQE